MNKKGITMTSLTIYVIVATIIVFILVFLNANFFSNINDLTDKANIVSECLNFKSALIRDIKAENDVKVTDYNQNMVRLSNDVKYEIRVLDKNVPDDEKKYAIYRNDVQIARSVVPHTQNDGQSVKEGPYFEYDVNTNTLKVGMKFSDGVNSYIEDGSYIIGKEIQITWANSNNFYVPSGDDIEEPDVSPDIPESERVYAVLYNDGTLQISNKYRVDQAKTPISDYAEVSAKIELGAAPWLSDKNLIRTVDFIEPVELLSLENMFSGCNSINEIRNTKNVITTNVTTANSAFKDCTNLKSIDISSWNTAKITDMSNMFDGCINLTSIDFTSLTTENVNNMSAMFRNCTNLKELKINTVVTSNVTDMSEMFSGCSSLVSMELNTFDTSNVTNMSSMFANCTSLKSLSISNFSTSKVTSMDKLFYNCRSLVTVSIENFDMSQITDMSYFFYNCMALTTIDFGAMDTSNVKDISYMFSNCTKLADIDFGTISTEAVENMEGLFYNCQSLESIDIKQFDTSNVTNMAQMFAGCMRLAQIDNFANLTTAKVTNMSAMFKDCSAIRTLELNDGNFDTKNVTDMSEMFKGCGSLYQIYLDDFDTSSVENMSSMFESCANLTELNLTNFDTMGVTQMNRMFMNASKLTKILVSDAWNTDNAETTDMFTGCGTSILTKS